MTSEHLIIKSRTVAAELQGIPPGTAMNQPFDSGALFIPACERWKMKPLPRGYFQTPSAGYLTPVDL